VSVTGLLLVLAEVDRTSAEPIVQRQVLSVAENLLREVELQPFTACDPDDAAAGTAASVADCASAPEQPGPEAGETRFGAARFDHVNDYAGYAMSPVVDASGAPDPGLAAYSATVAISQVGAAFALPADAALRIDVRAWSGSNDITLTGYRFRHSPATGP
jgi:MSHA pilin protein MshD